jgi:FAD/FMN-containing dehydrogenase/Fe-S oxidoreductase
MGTVNGIDARTNCPREHLAALERELSGKIAGELRTDRLARALYATDASIYQIVPDGVVFPKSPEDVIATVQTCGRYGVPVTARGAGTGLTGAAVNRGLQMDCSRHLNRILALDPEARTARVEPGVVLDELNAALRPHGLQFAPDVATSSRATIGGMIAVNSCGAHSILYGRTVDHVLSVEVVLSDGSTCRWGRDDPPPTDKALAQRCEQTLAAVAAQHAAEIAARFPRILRSNAGYALDRLRVANGRPNTETIICGSEGTLGIVTGAALNLVPLPVCRGLVVIQFAEVLAALQAVPAVLEHSPAAVELIDDLILNAAKANPRMACRRWFIEGEPNALLACELFDDDPNRLARRLRELAADLTVRANAAGCRITTDPAQQTDVWEVRNAGLGLAMSQPGDRQPYAFIEDAAVDPRRLPDYIRRLDELLAEEGVEQVGHYAHASVGCLHVRPVLNLKRREDIERMRRIADRVSSLTCEFGGTISGEHGDGIVRSVWLEKMYGPRILSAFRQIKETFDPAGILNPGKIVDPLPMTENLRYGEGYQSADLPTTLDFSFYGGLAGLAGMCTGVGQCRQRLVGTMCPSYMATGDETHTTRARANALRLALSNRGPLHGLTDPALDEVMDLCLMCKACRTECPTGVDLAKLKAEWLAHRNRSRGVPRRSRFVGASVELARWGSHFAPLSNWVMQAKVTRIVLEHLFGLDRRLPPPRLAGTTFRRWFAGRRLATPLPDDAPARPQVVYFADTWTNFYQPQVGQAAVKVLEALGYQVLVPATRCCGRPLISKGLLREARRLAEANLRVLGPYAERGVPIVGTEPSCVSALTDELPQLVRNSTARQVAACTLTVEVFVAAELRKSPTALRFNDDPRKLLYHGHCHQKALYGTADAMALLSACTYGQASEINSGCCGMAGAFGHEVEHYEVAKAIGEQRLFPAIRARADADVAVSGFSCREHIGHHTGVTVRHVIEYLADALR